MELNGFNQVTKDVNILKNKHMSNYHYTKAVHLANIVNEGKIRTTIITNDKKERPAVWLTKSEEWELCCSAGRFNPGGLITTRLSLKEMQETLGVCRIKISEKLQTTSWAKFKYVGKISESYYHQFDDFCQKQGGKTHRWNCSFKPISSEYFESIEMLVGDKWLKWDGSVSIEEFIDICHSCNVDAELPEMKEYPLEILGQLDFFLNKQDEIIEAWEKNKGSKGYLEIYVREDYCTCNIKYINKNIRKSQFHHTPINENHDYLYLHMLWFDTKTHYKGAFAYDPINKKLIMNDHVPSH